MDKAYVVYTAIFGNIGDSIRPVEPSDDTSYVAFVEPDRFPIKKQANLHGWQLRPPKWIHQNKRRQARQHKCMAHALFPEARYSLWVDGCLKPVTPMAELVEFLLLGADICTFEHMQRSCVYDELKACIGLKKDDPKVMTAQVERYRKEGYPENNGLAETTAVLRRHTSLTKQLNELWWSEICHQSLRDQLSFNYVCWQLGARYETFEGTRIASPYFNWWPHR